jgi:hypothetical protein
VSSGGPFRDVRCSQSSTTTTITGLSLASRHRDLYSTITTNVQSKETHRSSYILHEFTSFGDLRSCVTRTNQYISPILLQQHPFRSLLRLPHPVKRALLSLLRILCIRSHCKSLFAANFPSLRATPTHTRYYVPPSIRGIPLQDVYSFSEATL